MVNRWSTDGQPVRRRIVAFTQLGFVWFYWLMAPIRAAVSMGDSHWRDSFVTNARGDSPQRRTRETMVEKRDAFEAFLQWRIAVWTLCISPAPFFHVCKSVWEIGGTPDVASLLPLFFSFLLKFFFLFTFSLLGQTRRSGGVRQTGLGRPQRRIAKESFSLTFDRQRGRSCKLVVTVTNRYYGASIDH